MKFTKIIIFADCGENSNEMDILTSQLSDLGADGFEFGADSAETPTVTIYIPIVAEKSDETREKIENFLNSENLKYSVDEVNEQDWENNWKQYFLPFPVGKRLMIKPSWIPDSELDNPDNRLVLEIDPASAFGTGQHASTRLCLELLEEYADNAGDIAVDFGHVMDIGCGSGILSAAAGLLGAHHIKAVDICENAVRITEETFLQNNINAYTILCGNIITDENLRDVLRKIYQYDLVIANITADVIIAMADLLAEFAECDLILSGIIAPRLPEVLTALEPHFTVIETRESEDWVALVCSKK